MKKLSSSLLFSVFFLLIVFTRSFAGIYIFEYRLGEYLVAFGLLISFSLLFINQKRFDFDKYTLNIFKLIILAFITTILITRSDLTWTYTYRVTSYIWTASFVFIGYYLFKDNLSKQKAYILMFGILVIYVFGTGNYPDDIINIFKDIADKFTFVKASDMVLAIVVSNLVILNFIRKEISYIYFLISVTMFLPLIVQMSRGSAVALIMFAIMYIIFDFRYIFFSLKNIVIFVLLVPLVFVVSTYRVTQFDLSAIPTDELDQVLIESFDEEIEKIRRLDREGNEVDPFLTLYFEEREHVTGKHMKLISTDGTFNWRLDMWQELYYFQDDENKLLFGYGTTDKLPVFLLEYDSQNKFNIGHDQSNEQIHNYFVNIFGRGGFLQLFLFLAFHVSLYLFYFKKYKNHYILMLIFPSLFNSMTDISMEGVQFPINFYLTYGYLLTTGIRLKSI